MRIWPALALATAVAVVGAIGTLVAGALVGMDSSELAHLAALIAPALAVTIVAIALARALLSNVSMAQSLTAVAVIGSVAAIANLVVLTRQMMVDPHDATTVAIVGRAISGGTTGYFVGRTIALLRQYWKQRKEDLKADLTT